MTDTTDMSVEAPTTVTTTPIPQREQTTQKPERELTPEERRDRRLDEVIDKGIIFEDPNKAKGEIRTIADDYANEKVDEALKKERRSNQYYIGGEEAGLEMKGSQNVEPEKKKLDRFAADKKRLDDLIGFEP